LDQFSSLWISLAHFR